MTITMSITPVVPGLAQYADKWTFGAALPDGRDFEDTYQRRKHAESGSFYYQVAQHNLKFQQATGSIDMFLKYSYGFFVLVDANYMPVMNVFQETLPEYIQKAFLEECETLSWILDVLVEFDEVQQRIEIKNGTTTGQRDERGIPNRSLQR